VKQPLAIIGTTGNAFDVLDIVEAANADCACWEVVVDDVAEGTVIVGNPARPMRSIKEPASTVPQAQE
jgi:serine acetyltransferase